MKTLKYSTIPSLHIIDGSKQIAFPSCLVILFLAFLSGVKDRVLWCSMAVGLYLGAMSLSLVSALTAHTWGFLHPFLLSITHSMHMHAWSGLCALFCVWFEALFADLIRLATIFIL